MIQQLALGLSQLTSIRGLVYSNRRFLSTVLFTKYSEIEKIPLSRGVNDRLQKELVVLLGRFSIGMKEFPGCRFGVYSIYLDIREKAENLCKCYWHFFFVSAELQRLLKNALNSR